MYGDINNIINNIIIILIIIIILFILYKLFNVPDYFGPFVKVYK